MTDLNKVIDLRATIDLRHANCGAIDTGVRLDLNIIANHYVPRLHDLVPAAFFIFGEAKSIRPDHHAVLQNDVVADLAELPDRGMSVRKKVTADRDAVIDN